MEELVVMQGRRDKQVTTVIVKFLQDKRKYRKRRAKIYKNISQYFYLSFQGNILIHKIEL